MSAWLRDIQKCWEKEGKQSGGGRKAVSWCRSWPAATQSVCMLVRICVRGDAMREGDGKGGSGRRERMCQDLCVCV